MCELTVEVELRDSFNLGSQPPTEFRLFRKGVNPTQKGSFLFDSGAAKAVLAAFDDHGQDRLPIDFNHGMFGAVATAETAKAAGWFKLAIRDGELWAVNVEWTPAATRMLKDREFRFISPAFLTDKDGRIKRLLNVALTNTPATKHLTPLVARDDLSAESRRAETTTEDKQMSETLLHALGADSEREALKIANEWNRQGERLMAATGATTLDGAFDAIERLKADARSEGEKVVELAAKVAELEAEKEGVAKAALIKSLSEAGKAPPAMHKFLEGMSLAQLSQFAEVAPAIVQTEAPEQPNEAAVTLSAADVAFCEAHNIDTAAYLETVKAEQAALEG